MARLKQREEGLREEVINNCWKYLRDNFHKFNENNQIKVAIMLCGKDVPQEVTGDLTHTITEMPTIEKGNRILEYNIGNN